jgi:LysM repeat protein
VQSSVGPRCRVTDRPRPFLPPVKRQLHRRAGPRPEVAASKSLTARVVVCPPTPVAAPPPTIAAPAPAPAPQPQAQPTSAPPPPSQGQGGTITGETSPPFYIVQPGDSVWLIAHRFGVDMDALRALNNIVDNLIYPGQIIYLPGSGGSPAPPSAPGAPSTGADPGTGSQPEAGGSDPTLPTMPNTGITTRKP